jgi:hypothetical protein
MQIKFDETEFKKQATPDILKKYCEGCDFILDLYFNNNIKNYYWYYPYEKSPRCNEISKYINDNIADIRNVFDYTNKTPSHSLKPRSTSYRYFSRDQYKEYINLLLERTLSSIKEKINEKRRETGNYEYIENEEAFIYEHVDTIYECINKKFFNKCIHYDINLDDADNDSKKVDLSFDNFKG